MTKDELEKLIEGKPADVKARASVLFNAVLVTMSDYSKERSVANLRNMDAAKDAFEKYTAEIGGGKDGEIFDSIAAVVKYLDESGWQISDKTLYRHINKDRKLLRDSDGKFSRKAVDKYAATYLKEKSTGKKKEQRTDELQCQKMDQELKNLILKNERDQFNFDKERNLYIQRERMEIELATRAGILDAGLKQWIQSHVAVWIRICGGDLKTSGELSNGMIHDLNEFINNYAAPFDEFEVIIDADTSTDTAT